MEPSELASLFRSSFRGTLQHLRKFGICFATSASQRALGFCDDTSRAAVIPTVAAHSVRILGLEDDEGRFMHIADACQKPSLLVRRGCCGNDPHPPPVNNEKR